MQKFGPARIYALVVGGVLVAAGVLGFFYNTSFAVGDAVERDAVLGVLDVNGWHNVVHIATGALGLVAAGAAARAYALGLGVAYVLVFVLGSIAGDGGEILGLIPINTPDNILHLLLGLAGIGAGAASGRAAAEAPGRA